MLLQPTKVALAMVQHGQIMIMMMILIYILLIGPKIDYMKITITHLQIQQRT